MIIVTKKELLNLIKEHPDGGIVFAEYEPDIVRELMVTDEDFGATCVLPYHGEVFDYDWNIAEYSNEDQFVVLDNSDILQMIQVLTKGLKLDLNWNGPVW